VLEKFSSVVSVPIIGEISYSPNIPRWELKGMPVVEAIPDGIEAQQFQALSRHMLDRTGEVNPTPMSDDDILEGVFDD
jgi:nitrogenase subunit NifH